VNRINAVNMSLTSKASRIKCAAPQLEKSPILRAGEAQGLSWNSDLTVQR
jgi:hypothetical protein